jgi:hypothetical protein
MPAQPAGDGDGAVGGDPEQEALLADSVGLALLVVLDTLSPAERAAFVLHDMFDLPFEDIAAIVGRTPNAARLLASRARRRVRGADPNPSANLARQREVADAFLAATRRGDFSALIKVLDPEVVLRADAAAAPAGAAREVHGARLVAKGALAFAARARFAQTALVNGSVGVVVAPPRPAIRSPRVHLRRREDLRNRCDRRPRAAPPTRPCSPRQLTPGGVSESRSPIRAPHPRAACTITCNGLPCSPSDGARSSTSSPAQQDRRYRAMLET